MMMYNAVFTPNLKYVKVRTSDANGANWAAGSELKMFNSSEIFAQRAFGYLLFNGTCEESPCHMMFCASPSKYKERGTRLLVFGVNTA